MKRIIFLFVLIVATSLVWAADATFRSIKDGEVTVFYSSGLRKTAGSRDEIEAGDTIITGLLATAELDLARSGRILVGPDTVLSIQHLARDGETATVLVVAIGSVELFFPRNTELVKTIGSQTSVATVQGTPVTVHVAADGTTRFEVPQNAGASTAIVAGSFEDLLDDWTISVGVGQAVDVGPAERPGPSDVYSTTAATDFADWNSARYTAMVADPSGALELLTRELNVLAGNIKELEPLARDTEAKIMEHLATSVIKADREGAKASNEYYLKYITPLQALLAGLTAEMRFNAVLALLAKRHLLSTLYLEVTSRYFASTDDSEYQEFRSGYDNLVERYEAEIAPHLEPTDAL